LLLTDRDVVQFYTTRGSFTTKTAAPASRITAGLPLSFLVEWTSRAAYPGSLAVATARMEEWPALENRKPRDGKSRG